MPPTQGPLTSFERSVLHSIGLIERGGNLQSVTAALVSRFGYSYDEAQGIYSAAVGAQGAAVGASLAGQDELLERVVGVPSASGRVIVEATVTIKHPGGEPEYRTVRADHFGPENTVGEVDAYVQSHIDEWNRKYGADGRTMSYQLRYIF